MLQRHLLEGEEILKSSSKDYKIWKQDHLKHWKGLRFLRMDKKLEIAKNAKAWLLKTKNTRSFQKAAVQFVENPILFSSTK